MRPSSLFVSVMGVLGLVGLLSGCGGGESPTAGGSATGTAAASGTITGFGSVFVNGKKFETSGASFIVDGEAGRGQGDLKLGMTVTVTGSFSGGQRFANSVHQKDAVEGVVQSVAADGLSLVVMGQTVLIDSTTIFDNNVASAVGDTVEVNGHIRPGGVIQATFIEKKAAQGTSEVRGFVHNHNDGTKTFQIGALIINYATALINDMPNPAGDAWNGLLVEVKGTLSQGTLVASKVEPENPGVRQADEFEVEGFVTQVLGTGDFFIGGTHVQTTSGTEFRGGTIDEIVVGTKLSAEGRLANGILTAKHVKFHESTRLEGNVATIDLAAKTFTIAGLPGVTVTVNSQTEFKANGGTAITGLGDLAVGNHVRVRGRASGTTSIIATRVERRQADDDVVLQGPVQVLAGPNITILGVTVDTSGIDEFDGVNDAPISRTAFFNAVKVGAVVKVKGRLNGGVVTWREAELEDEE
ncbi:DUF5666 domain-containing protein [Nitrospira moscoviensis]|uniref:DUF5666 domain-containing protein n=1 Tax=Nitrospira moscoviensis TaxID=42253 RepID=A0A0K2G9C1_NITMO|nr:DUF5666 domain-containing protein [Nitrospira moscoviensis]ALA57449.1 conserved exported protein of unknown function [Nitrospira moscoviensis]